MCNRGRGERQSRRNFSEQIEGITEEEARGKEEELTEEEARDKEEEILAGKEKVLQRKRRETKKNKFWRETEGIIEEEATEKEKVILA
jgi:hypothetical protein